MPDGRVVSALARAPLFARLTDEQRRALATLATGSYFGEMGLVEGAVRSATAQMATAGEVLRMPKNDFQAMLQAYPLVAMQLNAEIIRRHRKNVSGALDDDGKS